MEIANPLNLSEFATVASVTRDKLYYTVNDCFFFSSGGGGNYVVNITLHIMSIPKITSLSPSKHRDEAPALRITNMRVTKTRQS